FNTAVSFITNTNWQNYGGESTLSYLVQMLGLTHQNFLSAATGIVLAVALIRGFARASMRTIGNFWVDITRCTLYILIPICIVYALFLVWQGMPQTLGPYVDATTLEGAKQTIAVGPVASQIAIKMLGTNGGGFFNANAAQPFENPTALSNFVQMISIFAVGAGMYGMLLFVIIAIFVAGLMVGRTPEYVGKKIEAKEVKMAMLAILILPLMYLGWTAVAVVIPTAVASMANPGPHGFTEVLYAYTSQTGNNGSA